MNDDIKKYYFQLEDILRDFDLSILDADKGKNIQIRKKATIACDDAMNKAEKIIFNNEELYSIWINRYPSTNPFNLQDFFIKVSFSDKMTEYLSLINIKYSIN